MVIMVKNIKAKPYDFTKIHEFQVCNNKLLHYIWSNLMKFIVIHGYIKNEKQNIGYINHSKHEKNSLGFIDVVARVEKF